MMYVSDIAGAFAKPISDLMPWMLDSAQRIGSSFGGDCLATRQTQAPSNKTGDSET